MKICGETLNLLIYSSYGNNMFSWVFFIDYIVYGRRLLKHIHYVACYIDDRPTASRRIEVVPLRRKVKRKSNRVYLI